LSCSHLRLKSNINIQNTIKAGLAVLLFLGFLAVAVQYYDTRSLRELWLTLGLAQLSLAIVLVTLSYLVRAWRFQTLLKPWYRSLQYQEMLRTTLLHNFFNNIIPMRLGELTFPALLKKRLGIPVIQGLGTLALIRTLDLILMATLFAVVITLLGLDWLQFKLSPSDILIGLAAISAGIFIMFKLALKSARLRELSRLLTQQLPALITQTLLIWLTKVLGYWWIMQAALQSDALQALLAVLATEATSILPVNGLANFGTLEASVWLALQPFDLDAQRVLSAAINLHLFILALSSIAALMAFTLMNHAVKKDSA